MANFVAIFIIVGLVPLGFLVVALYSNYKSEQSPSTQSPGRTPSRPITTKLREYLSPSHWCTQQKRNAAEASEDLEMQCIGMPIPTNASLHRAAALERRSGTGIPAPDHFPFTAAEAQRAAALTSLTLSSPSSCTSTVILPERPSAPSPPSSTASAWRFCAKAARLNWWQDAYEESEGEKVMPASRVERVVPGKHSVFRMTASAATEPARRGEAGGFTEVVLH